MAKKKSKRPNISQETLERARAEMRGEPMQAVATADTMLSDAPPAPKAKVKPRTAVGLATRHIPTIEELLNDYGYVLKDLRNMLILAGILFAAIIVAAFILPRPGG